MALYFRPVARVGLSNCISNETLLCPLLENLCSNGSTGWQEGLLAGTDSNHCLHLGGLRNNVDLLF